MKNLLLVCLVCISFSVTAKRLPNPTICKDNSWTEISVRNKKVSDNTRRRNYSRPFCVLPNGEYYSSWELKRKKNELEHLFDQYSGQQPTLKQIENAKKQIREDGYLVD